MGSGRRAPRGPPLLLALLLVVLVVPGPDGAAGGGIVERLHDGFGNYYKIHGYALGDPLEYKLAPITAACDCRRWCQVSSSCSSVSVVKVAGGVVECRYSDRPANLTDLLDRPRLNKTEGATHFLLVDESTCERLGHTGLRFFITLDFEDNWRYCLSDCPIDPRCSHSCQFAVVNTWALLDDAMSFTESGKKYNVYLQTLYPPNGNGFPNWGPDKVPHNASEISTINPIIVPEDNVGETSFYMKHDGQSVTLEGKYGSVAWCLCMDNPLNLEM